MRTSRQLAFIAALPLFAQGHPGSWHFTAGAGVTTPVGAMDARVQDGSVVQFGVTYDVSKQLGLRAEFATTDANLSARELAKVAVPAGTLSTWSLTLNPVWRFGKGTDRVAPYLIAGAGIARRTVEYTAPTTQAVIVYDPWWGDYYGAYVPADVVLGRFSQTKATANAGGGIEFGVGSPGTRGFLEARYVYLATTPVRTTYVPIVIGIRF